MKTLAESIRELMEHFATPEQIAQEDAPIVEAKDYSFTLKINNPEPLEDPDDVTWEEDIEVGIDYQMVGRHIPASHTNPAEHPEVGEIKVIRVKDNVEIPFNTLDKATQKYIIDQIYDVESGHP